MVACDVDQPEFYNWSEPVARKHYTCCECCAPIEKGEKHFKGTGLWSGDFSTHRQHLDCCGACMLIRDELDGKCIGFGQLFEWYGENQRELQEWFRKNKDNEKVKEEVEQHAKFRSLMARILWRDRAARRKIPESAGQLADRHAE